MIDWTGPVFFLLLFNCLLGPRHLRVAPVTPPPAPPPTSLLEGQDSILSATQLGLGAS